MPPAATALEDAYERALALEKSGRTAEAIAAWREVLTLDPVDHGGASVRLAALGAAEAPDRAPEAYVATLFDQTAEVFDNILVEQLGYSVPMLLRERVDALGFGPFEAMLDLGCGTGLAGSGLRDRAAHVTGVDLSEGMLAVCEEMGDYDALFLGDCVGFLDTGEGGPWDIVTACDLLPYLGDLAPLIAGAARRMVPDGLLALSTETLPDAEMGGRRWKVGPRHRFVHDGDYVTGLLAAEGFSLVHAERIAVRHELGAPVPGHFMLARSG